MIRLISGYMKNLIINQVGFSMVQGMVIAGVVAGSSLVATRLLTDQKLAQKNAETRDQIEDLHSVIYSVLQNRQNCEATIVGNSLTSSLLTSTSAPGITLPSVRTANPAAAVYSIHGGNINNTYMNKNVLIQSMNIVYNPAAGTANLKVVYERLQAGDINKKTKRGYGAKRISKDVKIRVQRNPFVTGKPFESCYSLTDSKVSTGSMEQGNDINRELCLEMNNNVTGDGSLTGISVFVWDEATSTCIPNAKCPDHMIFTGIDSLGDVKCRRIEEWANLGNMIDPTTGTCGPGKNVRFQISADKKKVNVVCY